MPKEDGEVRVIPRGGDDVKKAEIVREPRLRLRVPRVHPMVVVIAVAAVIVLAAAAVMSNGPGPGDGPSSNGKVQAVIDGPSTGYIGEAMTFKASNSTAPDTSELSYAWSVEDGQEREVASGTAVIFSTTINAEGTYTVILNITDGRTFSRASIAVEVSTREGGGNWSVELQQVVIPQSPITPKTWTITVKSASEALTLDMFTVEITKLGNSTTVFSYPLKTIASGGAPMRFVETLNADGKLNQGDAFEFSAADIPLAQPGDAFTIQNSGGGQAQAVLN